MEVWKHAKEGWFVLQILKEQKWKTLQKDPD